MNITLSADEKLIARSRKYAQEHNTTINNLVREFLQRIGGDQDKDANAEEFVRLAKTMGGRSEESFIFNRDELHERFGLK